MSNLEESVRGTIENQRASERRSISWSTLHGALFKTRRRQSRRSGDRVNSYLDWHGQKAVVATLAIILLCFADAFLTTVLLGKGAVEVNVLMDWLIQKDIHIFTVVKMAVTGIALLILLAHFNFRIYKYIAVRYLVYGLIPVYVVLILHELNMLSQL
jgi:predicted exporter